MIILLFLLLIRNSLVIAFSIPGINNNYLNNISEKEILIIGGNETKEKEFPFIVSLQSDHHYCGGTIISERSILTAAHCVKNVLFQITVISGKHDLKEVTANEQRRSVKTTIIHPDYNETTFENDIALLILSAPLQFNEYVRSVKLQQESKFDSTGSATIIGWGIFDFHLNPILSNVLLKAIVPLKSNDECNDAYNSIGYKIPSTMICAGGEENEPCHGDFGGPMICEGSMLCGIMSWGYQCGKKDFPSVCTRTSKYLNFIHNNKI